MESTYQVFPSVLNSFLRSVTRSSNSHSLQTPVIRPPIANLNQRSIHLFTLNHTTECPTQSKAVSSTALSSLTGRPRPTARSPTTRFSPRLLASRGLMASSAALAHRICVRAYVSLIRTARLVRGRRATERKRGIGRHQTCIQHEFDLECEGCVVARCEHST